MKYFTLCALLFCGAFFYQTSYAQVLNDDGTLGTTNEEACPFGGAYSSVLGFCFVPATPSSSFTGRVTIQGQQVTGATGNRNFAINSAAQAGQDRLHDLNPPRFQQTWACDYTFTRVYTYSLTELNNQPHVVYSFTETRTYVTRPNGQNCSGNVITGTLQATQITLTEGDQIYQCPPESSSTNFDIFGNGPYVTDENYHICYYLANDPDNDTDCPPDTIGGCDPPEPDCIDIGNGATICKADPNEKCDVSYINGTPVFTNCETGCGFEGSGTFVCTTEPDSDGEIPDLSKCYRVANGWACPSDPDDIPDPDDNITDPNKPNSEMTKQDFKDVNIGIESRLDGTNLLLSDIKGINAATNKGIGDLNEKSLAANGMLNDIRRNTGDTAGNTKDILDLLKGEEGESDGKCTLEEGCSWYESAYEDGMKGIWEEHSAALTNTALFNFLDQFKLEADGQQPDMQICFNLGALGDFGCKSLEVPSVVWAFLKFCILFSAAMLCRALIFGG